MEYQSRALRQRLIALPSPPPPAATPPDRQRERDEAAGERDRAAGIPAGNHHSGLGGQGQPVTARPSQGGDHRPVGQPPGRVNPSDPVAEPRWRGRPQRRISRRRGSGQPPPGATHRGRHDQSGPEESRARSATRSRPPPGTGGGARPLGAPGRMEHGRERVRAADRTILDDAAANDLVIVSADTGFAEMPGFSDGQTPGSWRAAHGRHGLPAVARGASRLMSWRAGSCCTAPPATRAR
jgi:hypothetical protein